MCPAVPGPDREVDDLVPGTACFLCQSKHILLGYPLGVFFVLAKSGSREGSLALYGEGTQCGLHSTVAEIRALGPGMGLKPQLYHFLAVRPRASPYTSLCHGFPICKRGQ